ncbi:hypothetical protein THASP1DRAFT_22450 [Thamnocephalis sphaerospora]|uniref:Required for respiratory growth protein 9, mitochondrial n=1 Tax=Thamnocephalis sphaerospora TaxID=78915 RepID=A0A4P9XVW6_9FUNG|nr:hypothetical protein THASP1DRAFT_22450 [Thamnocephalis sphaerospora]|eukprot:RKP09751.1 hypothetical protein THASP1DRAFT_22450 [Thamnocephalis sphaerospora]
MALCCPVVTLLCAAKDLLHESAAADTKNEPEQRKKLSPEERTRLESLSGWRKRVEEQKRVLTGPWRPEKRVGRETMEQIRMLNRELTRSMHQFPDEYDVLKLSKQFKISFEAVRRILHSKYQPPQEVAERQERRRTEQRRDYVDSLKRQPVEQTERADGRPSTWKKPWERRDDNGRRRFDGEQARWSPHERFPRRRPNDTEAKSSNAAKKPPPKAKGLEEYAEFYANEHPILSQLYGPYTLFEQWQMHDMYENEPNWKRKVRIRRARRILQSAGLDEDAIKQVWERWVQWKREHGTGTAKLKDSRQDNASDDKQEVSRQQKDGDAPLELPDRRVPPKRVELPRMSDEDDW